MKLSTIAIYLDTMKVFLHAYKSSSILDSRIFWKIYVPTQFLNKNGSSQLQKNCSWHISIYVVLLHLYCVDICTISICSSFSAILLLRASEDRAAQCLKNGKQYNNRAISQSFSVRVTYQPIRLIFAQYLVCRYFSNSNGHFSFSSAKGKTTTIGIDVICRQ